MRKKMTTDGGAVLKSDDPRVFQAKVLWDKGFGRELGIDSFDAYLATIPETSERPPVDYLNKLILVDRRVDLVDACRLVGLKYNGSDTTFAPFDPKSAHKHGDVYWMWCQDGRRNRNKKLSVCRAEFAKGEVGLDEFEFTALYAQDPAVIGGGENLYFLDLPGAVHADFSGFVACGGCWSSEPELYWLWFDHANSLCGSASRRE